MKLCQNTGELMNLSNEQLRDWTRELLRSQKSKQAVNKQTSNGAGAILAKYSKRFRLL
jgi:hypothetical protein